MNKTDDSSAKPELTPAQEAFARWLESVELGDTADFDAWCADHAALEPELRRLHASWVELRRAVDALDEPPRKQEWVTLGGADGAREPESTDGQHDLGARSLLARLRERATTSERYRIQEELGRGAEGSVFRAHDVDLGRTLAIKVMHSSAIGVDTRGVRRAELARVVRFLSEASATAKLDHPGIVPVHDVGVDVHGRLFFTMKLVVGRRLDEIFERAWRRGDGWDTGRLVHVLLRVCEAVQFAHSRGVVHRDLKPSNVLVGDFGEVYVMDWGLALDLATTRERTSPHEAQRTSSGSSPPVGTAPYLAPEQARGDIDAVDERADVYALGALLYHFLARRPPYVVPGERVARGELVRRVVNGAPSDLRELGLRAPRELVAISRRAMEREPSARYASAAALASDLVAFQQFRKGQAWRDGVGALVVKAVRRQPAVTALLVLVTMPLLALVASLLGRSAELALRERVELVQKSLATLETLETRFVAVFDPNERAGQPGLEVLEQRIDELQSLGLGLDDRTAVGSWRERLGEVRRDDPSAPPRLVQRVLGLRVALELCGAGHGARLLAGNFPEHLSERSLVLATSMANKHAQLCRAHAAIGRLLSEIELSPGERRFVELVDDFFERGVRPPAADILESSWPGTPEEFVRVAPLIALAGAPDSGVPMLERLAQQHPNDAAVRQGLARAYLARDPPAVDLAEPHASAYAALLPESPDAFDRWASVFVARHSFRHALELQRIAILKDDKWSRLWTNLAHIHLALDEDVEALDAATRACALPGAAKEAFLNRGIALIRLDHPELAFEAFDAALRLNENYPLAWYWKARCLVMLDRFEDAMTAHARAPELESGPYKWFLLHGQALLDRGEYECAQRAFEDAGHANPEGANARAGLARALVHQGQPGLAIAWLNGSLGNIEARAALACALTSAEALPLAARQLERVLDSTHTEIELALGFTRGTASDPPVVTPRERVEFLEKLIADPLLAPLWNASSPPSVVNHVSAMRRNAEALLEVARSMRP